MRIVKYVSLLLFVCFIYPFSIVIAQEQQTFMPTESAQSLWSFSGVIENESNNFYAYFFEMTRDGEYFHVTAALFDAETHALVFYEDETERLNNIEINNYAVGDAFLRFNPINERWVLGVKRKDKTGFNFKIDMQSPVEAGPQAQDLRRGLAMYAMQTSRVNGHIRQTKGREQFVTASNTWFLQLWLTALQDKKIPLQSLFCRFNDGSGFYTIKLQGKDAKRAALAAWLDNQGKSLKISQFVQIKSTSKDFYTIDISSPKHHYLLQNDLKTEDKIELGFIRQGGQGFCARSQHVFE